MPVIGFCGKWSLTQCVHVHIFFGMLQGLIVSSVLYSAYYDRTKMCIFT